MTPACSSRPRRTPTSHFNTVEDNFRAITYFVNCGGMVGRTIDLQNNSAHDNIIRVGTQSGAFATGMSYTVGLHGGAGDALSRRREEPEVHTQYVLRAKHGRLVLALERHEAMVPLAGTEPGHHRNSSVISNPLSVTSAVPLRSCRSECPPFPVPYDLQGTGSTAPLMSAPAFGEKQPTASEANVRVARSNM